MQGTEPTTKPPCPIYTTKICVYYYIYIVTCTYHQSMKSNLAVLLVEEESSHGQTILRDGFTAIPLWSNRISSCLATASTARRERCAFCKRMVEFWWSSRANSYTNHLNIIKIHSLLAFLRVFQKVLYKLPGKLHSFIVGIYVAPLEEGLLGGAPNPSTTKWNHEQKEEGEDLAQLIGVSRSSEYVVRGHRAQQDTQRCFQLQH